MFAYIPVFRYHAWGGDNPTRRFPGSQVLPEPFDLLPVVKVNAHHSIEVVTFCGVSPGHQHDCYPCRASAEFEDIHVLSPIYDAVSGQKGGHAVKLLLVERAQINGSGTEQSAGRIEISFKVGAEAFNLSESVWIWRWRNVTVVEHVSGVFQDGAVVLPAIIISGLNHHGSLLGHVFLTGLLLVCLVLLILIDSTLSGLEFVC